MQVVIREETQADFPAIHQLNTAAFGQEQEANLVDLLRNSAAFVPGLSLVAAAGDKIVGHILFTKIRIKDQQGKQHESLALAPMAVVPELQKHGIGGQLVQSGLAKARTLGYASVIVLGHEHYYPRFGFVPANRWNILPPFEVPENVFMAIELVPGGLTGISGTVEYPKEFEEI
jgi:putative acetyltransferase